MSVRATAVVALSPNHSRPVLPRPGHPAPRDTGAAAVEFALVIPMLLMILFGIVEYGLWFTDSIGLCHGAREVARAGVVGQWDRGAASCDRAPLPGASANMQTLACTAANVTPRTSSDLYVKIAVLDADGAPTSSWAVGGTLRVCLLEHHQAVTGLAPMPEGGVIRSRIDMAIEQAAELQEESGGQDALPVETGADWNWC